jgi:SNF2 family DNA or RNA helicase
MAGERGERGAVEGAFLFDDMGLGKTIQILSVIGYAVGKGRPTIIVVPAGLIPNWLKEIRKWLGSKLKVLEYPGKHSRTIITVKEILSYDIVLTSYNRVATEASQMVRFMRDMSHRREYPYPCPKTRTRMKRGGEVIKTALNLKRPSFQLLLARFHRAVFDECHQMRNPKSATTFSCCLLKGRSVSLVQVPL